MLVWEELEHREEENQPINSVCMNSFRWWLQEAVWEKWIVCKAVIKAGVCFEDSKTEIYFALLYFFLASHTNENVLFHQFWWIPVNVCVRVDVALQNIKLEEKKTANKWTDNAWNLFYSPFILMWKKLHFPAFPVLICTSVDLLGRVWSDLYCNIPWNSSQLGFKGKNATGYSADLNCIREHISERQHQRGIYKDTIKGFILNA